ncbi:MAG: ATP-binding protein [Nitrospirota bacterium]
MLRKILDKLLSRTAYTQPRIDVSLSSDALYIIADREDMEALFEHVLENSFEALNEENPFIRISSSIEKAPPHSLTVQVFNTGFPVKEEDVERLFSPFFSTKPKGTGFGLAIAKRAVRKNSGRLRIKGADNAGTRVVITLPRHE